MTSPFVGRLSFVLPHSPAPLRSNARVFVRNAERTIGGESGAIGRIPERPRKAKLLWDLLETMSELPHRPRQRVVEFAADTPGNARKAAAAWLSDFSLHGPLQIESIRTSGYHGQFVAVVAYWEEDVPDPSTIR